MKVACGNCKTVYNISDDKIAGKKVIARCKVCGKRFVVNPDQNSKEEVLISPDTSSNDQPISPSQPSVKSKDTSKPQQAISKPEKLIPSLSDDHQLFTDYPTLKIHKAEIYDFEEIFKPNKKGNFKHANNKLKVKILDAVSDTLHRMLNKDEKVMRIAKGLAYYPAELFFGNGYLTMMYNHYAIICTDRRIIFININSRVKKVTHYLFQLPYNELKNVKKGWLFGRIIFNRKKGARKIFNSIKRSLAKETAEYITTKINSPSTSPSKADTSLEDLCPSCFVSLQKNLIDCPKCKVDFKSPVKAALRSLLLPGLGDIYLGHKLIGTFELFGALFVWFIVGSILMEGGNGSLVTAIFILFMVNGVDGMMTYFMGKKGYILEKA
ncbi:MAG: zinc-ribbon domain-containing protein [Desulfobulbaceae bacterium]|nr:zinc-ribbon domain-containing protein [Desulfobulbaceae bacterium]